MTTLAIILVIAAAFCHAAWNLLAKKACGGTAFIWIFAVLSALLYLPLAVWILVTAPPFLTAAHLGLILGSGALHSVYFVLLDRGYRFGDLSVIYPLARGTGPLLSILVAILLLEERPSPLALTGAAAIGLGIMVITGNPFSYERPEARRSILYALCCGTAIAAYTVLDKVAVSAFLIPPLLLDWGSNLGRVLLLTPYALKNWDKVKEQWSINKKAAWGVAFLSPLAYILVLTAMVFSPVSYIAPAREISVLIGSFLGARLLAESNVKVRLAGAGTMFLGLIALAAG